MVTCTGHIGIHEGADGRTFVRCTDVHDVMAIKPNFLTSMGYHIFLSMVLRARAPSARAELRYDRILNQISIHMLQNKNALRTCGSAVTQRFTQYCQVSCVFSSTRFKLSLSNM